VNRGQALVLLGNGRYRYRTDALPRHSVLAFEILRGPLITRPEAPAQEPKPFVCRRSRRTNLVERMVQFLREQRGKRHSFAQVCSRLGISRSTYNKTILDGICRHGRVRRRIERKHRKKSGAVYWVEE